MPTDNQVKLFAQELIPAQDLNEEELDEQLQHARCEKVRQLLHDKELSQKQLDMLQPFWLEDLGKRKSEKK